MIFASSPPVGEFGFQTPASGGVGVEGRVEVDKVNALVGDVLTQDAKVVASITSCRAHAEQDQQSDKEANRKNPLTHPAKTIDAVHLAPRSGVL